MTYKELLSVREQIQQDILSFASDIDDEKIFSLVQSLSPDEAVTALVDAAYIQGAPDNVTVIVADIVAGQPDDESLELFGTALL